MVYARYKQISRGAPYVVPYVSQGINRIGNPSNPYNMYSGGGARGMTTYHRRNYRQKPTLTKVIMNTRPAKHISNTTSTTMTMGVIYSVSPTQNITQGDSNSQRDGDLINLAAIKIKNTFFSSSTAGAYTYRILVGYSGEEYNATVLTSASLTATEVFLPSTATVWSPNGIVNPKSFTVLHDELVDINSQIAATTDLNTQAFTVQLKDMKFPYQANGSVQGKFKNLFVVVTGAVAGGTAGTTSVGDVIMAYDLIFK